MEVAKAGQTSEELEAVATKLAQLFPARRAIRINANVNLRSAATGASNPLVCRRATPKQPGMDQGCHKDTEIVSGQLETSGQGGSFQGHSLLRSVQGDNPVLTRAQSVFDDAQSPRRMVVGETALVFTTRT